MNFENSQLPDRDWDSIFTMAIGKGWLTVLRNLEIHWKNQGVAVWSFFVVVHHIFGILKNAVMTKPEGKKGEETWLCLESDTSAGTVYSERWKFNLLLMVKQTYINICQRLWIPTFHSCLWKSSEREHDHIYSMYMRGPFSLTPMPFSIKKKILNLF